MKCKVIPQVGDLFMWGDETWQDPVAPAADASRLYLVLKSRHTPNISRPYFFDILDVKANKTQVGFQPTPQDLEKCFVLVSRVGDET